MPRHPYMRRSRHNVYYFRMVVPIAVRNGLGLPNREVRLSLRTKDRRLAQVRLAERFLAMTKLFQELELWEVDAEEAFEKFKHGLKLIRQYGKYDLDDEFDCHAITEELSGWDLECYVFAREHQEQKALKKRRRDADALKEPQEPVAMASQSKPIEDKSKIDNRPDDTVENALQRFVQSKSNSANASTIEKYQSQIRLFHKIIGCSNTALKLSDLSVKHMQLYSDALHELPIKLSPDDPRSLEELRKSSGKRLSQRTQCAHARAVSMFLTWCEEQQYQVAPNLHKVLHPLKKTPRTQNDRKNFLPGELKAIFEAETYQNNKFKRDSDYWVPIIGLLIGAREAEICQLYANDNCSVSEPSGQTI